MTQTEAGFTTGTARANGMELAYEELGTRGDPVVLMVMGLGTQCIAWPDELCQDLAARGHHVVRFDNRDIGASTHLTGVRAPAIGTVLARRKKPDYTVSDMARDALGLLDALELETAHVVGASMGGFIAQSMALQARERVRSLTLIMTSTGARTVGRADVRLLPQLASRPSTPDREAAGELAVKTFAAIGSPGFPMDAERIRDVGRRSFDRAAPQGGDRGGFRRQLAAVVAQSDRTERLRALDVPALVVHGLSDPLVSPSGGLALAKALRGSRFLGIHGMGHDLPRGIWDELAAGIDGLTARS